MKCDTLGWERETRGNPFLLSAFHPLVTCSPAAAALLLPATRSPNLIMIVLQFSEYSTQNISPPQKSNPDYLIILLYQLPTGQISGMHYTHTCITLPASHCITLHHTASHCIPLHHTASHCITLHHTASHCLHCPYCPYHTASHCITLHHTVSHCITLHHTASHCKTLHHTESHCPHQSGSRSKCI